MDIDDLIKEGEELISNCHNDSYGFKSVQVETYYVWRESVLVYLQNNFPNSSQVETVKGITEKDNDLSYCQRILSILKAFRLVPLVDKSTDYDDILSNIFERFHFCARQIKRRHDGRNTLEINDEYDVQDLLQTLLFLNFDDIRPEEWTPSYAGGSKRMDFLLKDEEIAIEVKMTRSSLLDKQIGDQLVVDIANYKQHPNCKSLYCFVYDPDGYVRNPRGLEKDLESLENDFKVKVFVRPR